MGPLMINMAFMPLYMREMRDVTPRTDGQTDGRTVESSAVFCLSRIRNNLKKMFSHDKDFFWISAFGYRAIAVYKQHIVHWHNALPRSLKID